MEPENNLSLPFLTRKMLDFEHAQAFELVVQSKASTAQTVSIVGATKAGVFTLKHTPLSTFALKTERFRLPDIPIWISAIDASGNFLRGDLFLRISLAINGDTVHQLAGGYIYPSHGITWPATDIGQPSDGIGNFDSLAGADPAANANAVLDVAANIFWRVHALKVTLVTSATAADRLVHFEIDDGDAMVYEFIAPVVQAASTTVAYHCWPGANAVTAAQGGKVLVALPHDLLLPAATRITVYEDNEQTGDDFGAITLMGERFFT